MKIKGECINEFSVSKETMCLAEETHQKNDGKGNIARRVVSMQSNSTKVLSKLAQTIVTEALKQEEKNAIDKMCHSS